MDVASQKWQEAGQVISNTKEEVKKIGQEAVDVASEKMQEAGQEVKQKGREVIDVASETWNVAGQTGTNTKDLSVSEVKKQEVYQNELTAIETAKREDAILQDAFDATEKKILEITPTVNNNTANTTVE